MNRLRALVGMACVILSGEASSVELGLSAYLEAEHDALLENRRMAMADLVDPYRVVPKALVVDERPAYLRDPSKWVENTVATVFWIGEQPTENNPVPNDKSAWDTEWQDRFGGYDDPHNRNGYWPRGFRPKLNPFYVALPYNDLMKGGKHKPEASEVIPWFREAYLGPGISVLKGRWVAIEANGRTAYAQWEDVGPFETDHWGYVFGHLKPRRNRNKSAGVDVSPAIRDYLKFSGGYGVVRWRFVEADEVPAGPWSFLQDSLDLPKR